MKQHIFNRQNMVPVKTSTGTLELTVSEQQLLIETLSGHTSMTESQQLYQMLTARGLPFPIEWELHVLRATLRELPERIDLILRLATVESIILQQSDIDAAITERSKWEQTWLRFSGISLIGTTTPEETAIAHTHCFADACELLSSPCFSTLTVERQTSTIFALHDTLMSAPSPDLIPIADLGLRQFRRMLDNPKLTAEQAMGVFDALHSMYFSGVSDVLNLRRFDAIVSPFEKWLLRQLETEPKYQEMSSNNDDHLTIAYLLHTAHFERGNAVSPLIVSLADMHAASPNRRIFLYLVQYVDPNFLPHISKCKFTVRAFPQGRDYGRINEITNALRKDRVDIVITEQNRAVAAALFVRRAAPLQMWVDTGFPFWNLKSLDWTLSPSKDGTPDTKLRKSGLLWAQYPSTLHQEVDESEVAQIRNNFPSDSFIIGVFVRLIKLSEQFLDLMDKILAAKSEFQLLITGTGDPTTVQNFITHSPHADRITFRNENVDLNIYGQVVDVMCDTFPFIGGNACREVMAQGTPVVSMLGTPWDNFLLKDRSSDLLATTTEDYINIVSKLYCTPNFISQQREIALKLSIQQTDPTTMIADIEAGIAAARTNHSPRL